MLPYLGAGAGQGLEDAYLLGHLLSHPQTTLDNVEVRSGAFELHRSLTRRCFFEANTPSLL